MFHFSAIAQDSMRLKQLTEVVVRSTKPLYRQQEEGVVVNVGNSVLSKGSAALEVLERSPGIVIDHRYNSISMNGKSGVTVYLNGRLLRLPPDQLMAFLSNLRADDIERIELLTTPGAKYDAEGNAGIINIVLKKNARIGTSGSVSITGGYGWGEKAAGQGRIAKNGWYGSYSYAHDRSQSNWHALATADEPLLGGRNTSDVLSMMHPTDNSHMATVGYDSRVGFGGSVIYSNSKTDDHTVNTGTFIVEPDSVLYNHVVSDEHARWENLITDLYYDKALRKGEKISADLDYIRFTNNRPSDVRNSFVNEKGEQVGRNDTLFAQRQQGYAHTNIQAVVAKVDYAYALSARLQLEAGIKGNYTRTNSVSGIRSFVEGEWVSGADAARTTLMKEWVGAGYTSLKMQLDSQTVLTFGGRYEYSNIAQRKMGMFFPSVFFTHGGWQLSYTKRISRPTYTDLANYVSYIGPTSIATGNPLLLPTVTNVVKLGYNWHGYSIALLASRDDHPIVRYQMTENADSSLLIVSSQNMQYQDNLTWQLNIPVKVSDWWSMNYNIIGGWRHFREVYTRQPGERSYFTNGINFSETFTLPKGITAEVSGFYDGMEYDGSKKVDGFGSVNVGVKKELGRNRGVLQLAVTDIFSTMHVPFYFGKVAEEAHDLKSRVVWSGESTYFPVMKLTWSKSFGNGGREKREAGAKEERDRMK